MILRESDWKYFPDAVAHYETKNASFLKLAYIHKKQGIKHWYGCLALTKASLKDVNAHANNLTLDQKAQVVHEFFVNFWYYFREVSMVPQDGSDPVPFQIHRGSFALIWAFFNNIDIALLLIRQQGKTIALAALLVYLKRVLKNARTLLITKDSGLRIETISKMKQMRDALPGYAWSHSRNDADNTEIFTYVSRSNKLITAIAQNSKESALNAGRGLTAARLVSDETAFTKFVRIMLPAALAAGTTARRIAEAEGIPYGNIFTTTPGKRDEEDGKYVFTMFHDGMYWEESFLDIESRERLADIVYRGGKGDRTLIHAPFTHRQLGLTDLDLYKAMSNAGGTREEKMRDFGLRWTAGSLSSPLTVDESNMVSDSVKEVAHTEIFANNYVVNWYYTEMEKQIKMQSKHILGLDTSDAVGRDNIQLHICNSENLETAGTATVNESNLIVFANWLSDIMTKYPETILVIERKSSAATIIDSLLLTLPIRGIEPTRRIFNRIVQDRDSNDSDFIEFKKSAKPRSEKFYEIYRKHFGFITSGTSRKLLYGEVLQTAVRMAGDKIKDKGLASELLALVVKDGRIDHKASGHDDAVIAWLLACWFMLFGKRLDYYGVSNRILMKRMSSKGRGEDFDDESYEREEEEQSRLHDEIDNLCTVISTNKNPFLRSKYERQLRVLLSKLKLDTTQAATVGELQELIKNEKLQSRYL